MLNSISGAVLTGLVYGLMVLGVYITFRILKIPDLTVDGSIVLGMSVCAVLTNAGHPFLALLLATGCGAIAGLVTGVLQTKVKVPAILSGILTMTGLYSVNLLIMSDNWHTSTPTLSLLGASTIYTKAVKLFPSVDTTLVKIIVTLIICAVAVVFVEMFFKTHLGLSIRATGDNEEMVRSTSIHSDAMKTIALSLANALVALSGALFAQYMGYSDVTAGSGTVVVGFASVIIGEALLLGKKDNLSLAFVGAILGSVVYRIIVAVAIQSEVFPSYFLKLVSVLIIVVALGIKPAKDAFAKAMNKKARISKSAVKPKTSAKGAIKAISVVLAIIAVITLTVVFSKAPEENENSSDSVLTTQEEGGMYDSNKIITTQSTEAE